MPYGHGFRLRWEADRGLASHITRIQTAGDGRVGGSFDDGPAVREERHLVGVVPEFQDKVVVAHNAVRAEAVIHFGEVDGPLPFMDLDRIPSA